MAKKFWIAEATKNKGGLRNQLGIAKGKNIPLSKLRKATKSKNTLLKKRAILAETLRGFRKK